MLYYFTCCVLHIRNMNYFTFNILTVRDPIPIFLLTSGTDMYREYQCVTKWISSYLHLHMWQYIMYESDVLMTLLFNRTNQYRRVNKNK